MHSFLAILLFIAYVNGKFLSSNEQENNIEGKNKKGQLQFDEVQQKQLSKEIPRVECITPECQEAAKNLQSFMDVNVDPCDDFYQFTCGNYGREKTLENNQYVVNAFSDYEERAQEKLLSIIESKEGRNSTVIRKMTMFYQNCIDPDQSKSIVFIRNLLNQIDGWPVLVGDSWDEGTFDFKRVFKYLTQYLFFVTFPVSMSFRYPPKFSNTSSDTKMLDLLIHLPGNIAKIPQFIDQKLEKMIELAVVFGADPKIAKRDMEDMIEFEIKLALARIYKVQNYSSLLVDEDYLKNNLSWISYWDEILEHSVKNIDPNLKISFDNVTIYIENHGFLPMYKYMLDNWPKRVLANYMFYNALLSSLECVINDFDTPLKNIEFASKKEFCFDKLGRIFSRAVPVLYNNLFVPSHNSETVRIIAKNVKDQYLRELIKLNYSNDVISNVTKYYESLEILYGYFESLKNETYLETYYADLNPYNSSFYENLIEAYQILERDDIFYDMLSLLQSNAFFDSMNLRIGLPAPVMEVPLLSTNYPPSINYGGLGFIFAHELAHALLRDPLLDYPRTKENAECIVKQYGNYPVYEPNMTLDGELTKDENIADNAGVQVAYNAYMTAASRDDLAELTLPGLSYTSKQLFWISLASNWCQKINNDHREEIIRSLLDDDHSPANIRINLAFINMKEFSQDFHCKLGSKMNPVTKCKGVRK